MCNERGAVPLWWGSIKLASVIAPFLVFMVLFNTQIFSVGWTW